MFAKRAHFYGVVKTSSFFWIALLLAVITLAPQPVNATVNWSDDVDPTDPTEWTTDTTCYIGKTGVGTLEVISDEISSYNSYLGHEAGSSGTVTVEGAGSTWANDGVIYVGNNGDGTLKIRSGGQVDCNRCYVSEALNSTGIVNLDGLNSVLNCSNIDIGRGGEAELNITNKGTANTNYCYIGSNTTSKGTVNVDGLGSTLKSSQLRLAWQGTTSGTLNITNGGKVENSGTCHIGSQISLGMLPGFESVGLVTIDGSESVFSSGSLLIGDAGNGTLNILNGGEVNVAGTTYMSRVNEGVSVLHFNNGTLDTGGLVAGASQLTGTGTINTHGMVYDCDMTFSTASDLEHMIQFNSLPDQNVTINVNVDSQGTLGAGATGNGSLTIQNGVAISSSNGYIGYGVDSVGLVTVTGPGTSWATNSDFGLYVGSEGNGTLNIKNGATVSSNISVIGEFQNSTGQATVDCVDSTWNTQRLSVGLQGRGELEIVNGGSVRCSNGATIGYWRGEDSVATGTVTVHGVDSSWDVTGMLCIGQSGNGTLNIMAGGQVSDDNGRIGLEDSAGQVTVEGKNSVWINRVGLTVGGFGDGTLSITDGGLVTVGETLKISYNNNENCFINMATGGMLALFGDADDSLDDFFDLIEGTDTIQWWDDSIGDDGDWALLTTATLGTDYTLEYLNDGELAGYTLLTVAAVPEPGTVALLLTLLMVGASYTGGLALLRKKCDNKRVVRRMSARREGADGEEK